MAVPATTGVLRTKVSDMEVGDYIIVTFTSSASVGYVSEIGTSTSLEMSTTGMPASSTGTKASFYFIKIGKGLLVADRVVRHSATWDTINLLKMIQGSPYDNGNIIPTMTSNTSPSGVASESSVNQNIYYAWKAFNKTLTDNTDNWISTDKVGWIAYEFSLPKVIQKYTITSRLDTNRGDLKTWTFEGSQDGVTWIKLHEVINERAWGSGEKRSYIFTNIVNYKHYRVNITDITIAGSASYISIGELEMFETAGIIRSLTGGVAYADANGNPVMNDAEKGGWPINNEWTKFIVNFPTDKILSGKVLNDVFHFDVRSWLQDTPMNGVQSLANNTYRTAQANNYLYIATSSTASTAYGFRPCFEYKE
jgi:hypothetical protein